MRKHDAQPVSGEILIDVPVSPKRRMQANAQGVVDADYVVIGPSARGSADQEAAPDWLVPGNRDVPPVPPLPVGDNAADGLGMLRPGAEPGPATLSRTGFHALSAMAIAATFWFSGGYSLLTPSASKHPQARLSGVKIVGLESRFNEKPGGRRIILVSGTVENQTQNPAGVPPLAVKVSEQGGANRRYVFGTQNKILGGGESYRFALRLDAPDRPVDKLTVEFSRE